MMTIKELRPIYVNDPALIEALLKVHNSGPLNNGLRDENTMKMVTEALEKAGAI